MKNLILLAITLFFSFSVFAQEEENSIKEEKDFGLTINYYGELDNQSGLEIGMESSILKNMFMAYHVGFYFAENNRTDVSLYWEMGYRKTFKSGYSPDARVGIGYLTTYVPENAEEGRELLEIVYMPSITVGAFGWDFRKTKNIPLRIFGNVMVNWAKPIGKSGEQNVAFQTGVTFFIE